MGKRELTNFRQASTHLPSNYMSKKISNLPKNILFFKKYFIWAQFLFLRANDTVFFRQLTHSLWANNTNYTIRYEQKSNNQFLLQSSSHWPSNSRSKKVSHKQLICRNYVIKKWREKIWWAALLREGFCLALNCIQFYNVKHFYF